MSFDDFRFAHHPLSEFSKPNRIKFLAAASHELMDRLFIDYSRGVGQRHLIKQRDFDLPVFDTTRLHSQMAVDFTLGKQELAHVRPDQ
jgi:hypothetical protein